MSEKLKLILILVFRPGKAPFLEMRTYYDTHSSETLKNIFTG
jgi:hypothetical protein